MHPIRTLLLAALAASACAAAPSRPNFLFLSIDDLRPELGCYGAEYMRTPNIDQIARTGFLFERAYCQLAVCTPSRASLFTGLRPDTLQVWHLRESFREKMPEVVTLPQRLREQHGYATMTMGKILWPHDPISWSEKTPPSGPSTRNWADPAVKYADPTTRAEVQAEYDAAVAAGLKGIVFERAARGPAYEKADVPDDAYADGKLAQQAVTALRALQVQGRPFFLAVGFQKPHLPFNAPAKYWDLYDPDTLPPLTNNVPTEGAPWYAVGRNAEFRGYDGTPDGIVPAEQARRLRHAYYACVSYVDAQVGRVMAELDRLGLADNTVVVVWGDHGYKLGEHTGWGKSSNIEEDIRVPLIIRAPGQPNRGSRTGRLVEIVDVYPTLLDLAGLPIPSGLEGLSLRALFADPQRPWKTAVFTQYPRNTQRDELEAASWDLMGRTIRTERFRLTRWDWLAHPGTSDGIELYDHQRDPAENRNVVALPEYADTVRELSSRLDAGWRAALPPATGNGP